MHVDDVDEDEDEYEDEDWNGARRGKIKGERKMKVTKQEERKLILIQMVWVCVYLDRQTQVAKKKDASFFTYFYCLLILQI